MKKLFFVFLSLFFLAACSRAQSDGDKTAAAAPQETKSTIAEQSVTPKTTGVEKVVTVKEDERGPEETLPTPFQPLTQEKDSVIVSVENIEKSADATTVTLALNNHRYDLSAMDVVGLSGWGGVRPTDYRIENTFMGGHHVSAQMTFPGKPEGELVIGLRDDLMFNFNL